MQRIKVYNEVSAIDCCSADDVFKQDVVSNLQLLAAGKTCFFLFLASSYVIGHDRLYRTSQSNAQFSMYACRKLPFSILVRDRHLTNSYFTMKENLTENEVKGENVFIDQIFQHILSMLMIRTRFYIYCRLFYHILKKRDEILHT